MPAERLDAAAPDQWWDRCGTSGRALARKIVAGFRGGAGPDAADGLLQVLAHPFPPGRGD